MANIDRTVYPIFARRYDQQTLQSEFPIRPDELKWIEAGARKPSSRLALAALLKCFQHLRYFPELEDVPDGIYAHCREALGFGERILADPGKSRWSLIDFKAKILDFLEVKPYYGDGVQAVAEKYATEAAEIKDQMVDIINATVDGLVSSGIELPAFSTVTRIASTCHNLVEKRIVGEICGRTPPEIRAQMLGLLNVELNAHESEFQKLKRSAGNATRKKFERLVSHIDWLETFGDLREILDGVIDAKIRYFGNIAKNYDAAAMSDVAEDKRLVCVLSLIRLMQVRARDQLGEMFLKTMAAIEKSAKVELEGILIRQRGKVERLVVTLDGVLRIINDEDDDTQAGKKIRAYVGSGDTLKQLQQSVEEVQSHREGNHLPLLWQHFISRRSILFAMLRVLELEFPWENKALIAAIQIIKDNQEKTRTWLPDDIDLSFTSARWRDLLRQDSGEGKGINRRHFEVCVFMRIAEALRSGDLAIARSDEFSDYNKELLPWDQCVPLIKEHCDRIGIPSDAKSLVAQLRKELEEDSQKLDDKIPQDTGDVILSAEGLPTVRRGEARPIPDSVFKLKADIAAMMPQRHVMDCLENIEHLVHFTRHFGPLTGNEPKLKDPATRYLQTIFAYGCNLGPTQAARHFKDSDVSAHMLSMANRRHITLEMLETAQRELNELYLRLPLPKYWGDGKTIAADGTQHEFYDDNLKTGFHFRYRKTGAVAYRHVADNYIAIFRHFIGPGIWEAIYVIEGLMKANLSTEVDTIHSDTQGQNESVFAYTYLYGVKLMPRIRNWKNLHLYRSSNDIRYEHIDKLFTREVDWDQIEGGWKQIMQVAMSIITGRISSARLLRKLNSYSRRNSLYAAAQALGRVIRTIYLLKWIGSRELREDVTATTNKIESYNGYSKWMSFGGDVIPVNDPDEQQKRLRYIDLVTSVVILQNTVDMQRVIAKMRKTRTIPDSDLRFLSPYLGEHLMRFGKYRVRLNRTPEPWILEDEYQAAVNAVIAARRHGGSRVDSAGAERAGPDTVH